MMIADTDLPARLSAPEAVVWQLVVWPQPLREEVLLGLLRQWATQHDALPLVLEARSDVTGVEYLVGCQARYAAVVKRSIEQLVVGSVVLGHDPAKRRPVQTVRRVRLSSTLRPLEPVSRIASSRAILSALTAVQRGEQLVIQVVLGAGRRPALPPARSARDGQSIVSKLLYGVQIEARPDVRQALIRKLGTHGFATTIRLGTQAGTDVRRKHLLLGLASAVRTVESAGVHLKLVPDNPVRVNTPRVSRSLWTPTQHLNVLEVNHLLAWPVTDRDTDAPLPGQPPKHPKPLPPTASVLSGQRIVATANAPGSTGTIGYNILDALRHTWAIGPSGTGKSTLLLNLIVQDLEAGRPLVVIEPKDLIADVLQRIPANRVNDVVLLDPLDTQAVVGINPLARAPGDDRTPELVADSLFGTFAALYGESLGPRSADILRNCLQILASRDDASLAMVPLLLTNPAFRRSLTGSAMRDDPFSAGPFWAWFDSLSPEAVATVTAPLANKLRPLLTRQLRAVLAQRTPRFNIRQVLSGENKVLLAPLQPGVLGKESAQLLGAILVSELWQAIRERASVPEPARVPVICYIDECQEYLKMPTDIGEALAQARSLRAGFVLAHQYQKQLPAAMLDAFRNNCRSIVAFQLAAGDAKDMAAGQSLLAPEDFSALPAYGIYSRLIRDNSVQPWVSGTTLAPAPVTSHPDRIRQLSRQQFGQPLGDIEAGFAALLTKHGTDRATGAPQSRKARQL